MSASLPPRPNLEQYRKQAKDLRRAYASGDPEARRRVRQHRPDVEKDDCALSDAQLAIAREHGFESWPRFAKHIREIRRDQSSASVWRQAERAIVRGDLAKLEALLREHADVFRSEQPQSWWNNTLRPNYEAGDARAIIASTHQFEAWDSFAAHQASVSDFRSDVAHFESAVDMVIRGDLQSLTEILNDHPELVSTRSKRKHHSALLHYVGANGVEGFRQYTPKNAVAIAELLLDRGADVNAVADMYGGSTALGLAATSLHPKRAGVQQPLIRLLIDRGATFDDPSEQHRLIVRGCLANGRPEAAEYLADRGAPLDLVGAAGTGRLDTVRSFFPNVGAGPSTAEMASALLAAAMYGHTVVAEYLLDRGVDVDAEADGFTAANTAALSAHVGTLRMLITRGASLEKRNKYGGTALESALWGARNREPDQSAEPYVRTSDLLVASGASVSPGAVEWWQDADDVPRDVHAAILASLTRKHYSAG